VIKITNRFKIYPGLGDAIFLYPIAKWFTYKKRPIQIKTKFKEIFHEIIKNPYFLSPDCLCHPVKEIKYRELMCSSNKNIFEDICDIVGAPSLDFKLDHPGGFLKIDHKRYCVIKPPYYKYNRHRDTAPNPLSIQLIIDFVSKYMPVILVKHDDDLFYEFEKVTCVSVSQVSDLIGIIKNSSLAISQTGHFQHLAESLGIPSCVVFSSKMVNSDIDFVKMMRPEKIIIGKKTKYVFDNDLYFENIFKEIYENWLS
jgi:hypothetical protein